MKHSNLTFCILHSAFCIVAATAVAGWEDTGVVRQPAATPPRQPAQRTAVQPARTATRPQRQQPAQPRYAAPAAQPRPAGGSDWGQTPPPRGSAAVVPPDLYSVFLDTGDESDAWYRLAYVASGDIEESKDGFGLFVAEAHFRLGEFRDLLAGDLTIDLNPSLGILTDDAGFNFMPSILTALPFDFAWTWRYLNGWSFELGATPGIYADAKGLFQGSAFGFPFRGCFYYALSSETSVRFGAEIRPGWDLVAMPLVGIAWQPTEMFIAELGLPRSFAELQLGPVGLYGKIAWNNTTYALDADNGEPDSFTLNGWQFGAGVSISFTETIRLAAEAGVIAGRDITFDGGEEDIDLDVDTVPYLSLLFGSEF